MGSSCKNASASAGLVCIYAVWPVEVPSCVLHCIYVVWPAEVTSGVLRCR